MYEEIIEEEKNSKDDPLGVILRHLLTIGTDLAVKQLLP